MAQRALVSLRKRGGLQRLQGGLQLLGGVRGAVCGVLGGANTDRMRAGSPLDTPNIQPLWKDATAGTDKNRNSDVKNRKAEPCYGRRHPGESGGDRTHARSLPQPQNHPRPNCDAAIEILLLSCPPAEVSLSKALHQTACNAEYACDETGLRGRITGSLSPWAKCKR